MAPKSDNKLEKNKEKRGWYLEHIFKQYFGRKEALLSGSWEPKPYKNIVKTMVLEGFSVFDDFYSGDDFYQILLDFDPQNCSQINKK